MGYANGGKCWRWDTEPCKAEWKYGPWGEDLFMQKCMDDAEVQKKLDFTLTDTAPALEAKSRQEEHVVCAFMYGRWRQEVHCCPPDENCCSLERLLHRHVTVRGACIWVSVWRAPWSAHL